MIAILAMNPTRKYILRAIRELSRSREPVTYQQIADYSGVSYKTAQRAVGELLADQMLSRYGAAQSGTGKGVGYYYEVKQRAKSK